MDKLNNILIELNNVKKKLKKIELYIENYCSKYAYNNNTEQYTSGEILSYKNLIIDKDSKSVKIDNKIIDVNKFEYMALLLFLNNIGVVLNRIQIYTHVYNKDNLIIKNYTDNNLRNIDVNIYRLRNKIGWNIIKTKRGFGYYIEQL